MEFKPTEHPHNRYNPLKDEWVLVSPHRCLRPWSGQVEPPAQELSDNTDNPLKPGAIRSNGQRNPPYTSTYVFPNDFPALLERVPEPPASSHPLFQMTQAKGTCRWMKQTLELGRRYAWVQVFENKGAIMGCSNSHPHCQIWASSYVPNEGRIKDRCQKEYYDKYGRAMLVDYLEEELKKQERIVIENSEWVALVPYWASWPFETMLLPKNNQPQRLTDLNDAQVTTLARIMKELTSKYDKLFDCSFPYSMGWHGAPTGPSSTASPHWCLHAMFLPPLLRAANIKKHMVGYELLAQPQRDLTPEQAATQLKSIHVL